MPWSHDDRIVPGARIGGFELGRMPDEILPADRGADTGIAQYAMRHQVQVELEKGRIVALATGHSRYGSEQGFRVGGSFHDVVSAWGEPPHRTDLEGGGLFDYKAAYPERGADFVVKDDRILYIGVFPPEPRETA